MTPQEEVRATLNSPGMKIIARELRALHKAAFLQYRGCQDIVMLTKVQTTQFVLDTLIPKTIEKLMKDEKPVPEKEKWSFWAWLKNIKWKG
jgi:hypothetical protein